MLLFLNCFMMYGTNIPPAHINVKNDTKSLNNNKLHHTTITWETIL